MGPQHEKHCVACGYERMSYYLTVKDICLWCDYFIPEHIPSEQARRYLNAIVLKRYNHKLVYERKASRNFLKKSYYTRMTGDGIDFLDDLSGVTKGMSTSYATSSVMQSSNMIATQTYSSSYIITNTYSTCAVTHI